MQLPYVTSFFKRKTEIIKTIFQLSVVCVLNCQTAYYFYQLNWGSNPYQTSHICKLLCFYVNFLFPLYSCSNPK